MHAEPATWLALLWPSWCAEQKRCRNNSFVRRLLQSVCIVICLSDSFSSTLRTKIMANIIDTPHKWAECNERLSSNCFHTIRMYRRSHDRCVCVRVTRCIHKYTFTVHTATRTQRLMLRRACWLKIAQFDCYAEQCVLMHSKEEQSHS